ncbi:anti-sigma factor family protein [Mesorhizobium sp. L-8-3]|uniref:anti-sigma factor family protein n=1 Tax=Mesorhizobium sp. L-8-3 TaxID=2744522 RepID=UPI00192549C8|nr:anti-sigma factor [Mesorhizobium sp. L-8-3]BCH25812.1 transcriptional regulator (anti-sigma factor) [Mesorhizobium sp. L-8-3]
MSDVLDPVTDADLDAYVDDQLDVTRRIEVEAFLSVRPETAARVMADLRTRDELRVALAGVRGMPRPATAEAARRLERGLSRRRLFGALQRAAAVLAFVAAGWLAHEIALPIAVTEVVASMPPPAYVEDAIRAHGTSVLRASMSSQPEVTDYDPVEIRSATAIVMPDLPGDWDVRDVQIYPSRFGPSVEMAVGTRQFGPVSLFAVRPGSFDVVRPTLVPAGEAWAAYFQIGEVAYALVATGDPHKLERAAKRLFDTLH